MLKNGTIIKGIGGFYYVDTGDNIVECKARGNFRNKKITPCVGDIVDILIDSEGKGTIDTIRERTNYFIRPPVSNVEEMIVVVSAKNPEPDFGFVDKMLIIAQCYNVGVKICFNKNDLDDGSLNEYIDIYRNAGYSTFVTSTLNDLGIESVKDSLTKRTTVFSGLSGVGKSSLLNAVLDTSVMETGEVSKKLKRGKHTTRHVELIKYNDGYIVDTPGFSVLDFPAEVTKDSLRDYYPEFVSFEDMCKFRDCNHLGNSGICAVCKAVEDKDISEMRYNNYKNFYDILAQRKEWKK